MPVERRGQVIALKSGQPATGGTRYSTGRRQPSRGGTSRMTRECQVRICERLGVQFPGPTRQFPGPTRPQATMPASTELGRCPLTNIDLLCVACLARHRQPPREPEQDLSPDPGRWLLAAVCKYHDPELFLRDHADIGGSSAQPAILLDDARLCAADDLPGQCLSDIGVDCEDTVLRQCHCRLEWAVVGKLTQISGEEGGHVPR